MAAARVLLTGSSGFLGHHVVAAARQRGIDVVTSARRHAALPLDLEDAAALRALPRRARASVVLHAAARARMADCATDPEAALRCNGAAVTALAAAGVPLLQVSTDLVFDGEHAPYAAGATPNPRSAYGRSKLAGERAARAAGGVVVRLPLLFGPSFDGRRGATDMLRAAAREGRELGLFVDEFRTPLHVADAAAALLALCLQPPAAGSVLHVAGPERVSRHEFAQRFAAASGAALPPLRPAQRGDPARPRDVSLRSDLPAPRSLDAMLAAS